jgi:glucokinase
VQALDLFVAYYGSEAGNLALKLMATGGVYIGGGIAPKILPWLSRGDFMKAFFSKGRMRPLLEAMPVRVILNPKTALLGAAHYAAFGSRSIASPATGSA